MDQTAPRQDGDSLRGMERKGADDEVVMVADDKPPREISPGRKPLKDLVPSDHRSTIVKGVKWIPDNGVDGEDHRSGHRPGQSGQLVFPSSFSGEIATDLATPENVKYYGAELANRSDKVITVRKYHRQLPFTYYDGYLQNYVMASKEYGEDRKPKGAGGASLERHAFCHTDTPSLGEDGDQDHLPGKGIFVMGKFLDEAETELELTGFVIPPGDTLWVPEGTIHTNNYLKGTWTTMLNREKEHIDEVKMIKDGRNFHFSFK